MIPGRGPRKAIAVIGCEVLEDEIVHVLAQDRDLARVTIIESPPAAELADKLRREGGPDARVVKIGQVGEQPPSQGLEAIVWINPISLHQSPPRLREEVVREARELASFSASILIFYGLCGNAFRGIDRIASEFDLPLLILRDAKGLVVDDCVGAVLGGTEEYRDFLLRDKGGYTLNTMWAAHWRTFMHDTQLMHDPDDPEEAKLMFQCMDYSKAVLLVTGLGDQEAFQRQASEFERTFGLGHDEVICKLDLVEGSYRSAKAMMAER